MNNVERVIEYIQGCNIDLGVALADLNLPADSVSVQQLEYKGYARCEGCGAWMKRQRLHICQDCKRLLDVQ